MNCFHKNINFLFQNGFLLCIRHTVTGYLCANTTHTLNFYGKWKEVLLLLSRFYKFYREKCYRGLPNTPTLVYLYHNLYIKDMTYRTLLNIEEEGEWGSVNNTVNFIVIFIFCSVYTLSWTIKYYELCTYSYAVCGGVCFRELQSVIFFVNKGAVIINAKLNCKSGVQFLQSAI